MVFYIIKRVVAAICTLLIIMCFLLLTGADRIGHAALCLE